MEKEKLSLKRKKLPPVIRRKENPKPTSSKIEQKSDNKSMKEAVLQIQNVFLLHAWRSQKQKYKELDEDVKKLKVHASKMEIQVYALHQLLDAEKGRVTALYEEVHKLTNNAERNKIEKNILQKDKEELAMQVEELKSNYTKLENKWKNQKNELMAAKSDAENWEKQLQKEREKLAKIRSNKKALIEEINEECSTVDSKTNPRLKNAALRNLKKPLGRPRDEQIEKIDLNKKK